MIEQSQEEYTWYADYNDDRPGLHELNACNFAEVDQTHVKVLYLLPLQGGAAHRVDIPQDATPIFFRRRSVEINPMQGESSPRPTVHCIGWKRGDKAVYLFVLGDSSTLLTTDLQAV
jgi:hypothetical protein